MNKKILYVNWGGLGDHLSFTTLPEAFNKQGFEFYISDKSVYRDPKFYDLIWGENPYVKGISSEEPNCGHTENWSCEKPVVFNHGFTINRNIEMLYGIDSNDNYPIIHTKPINLTEYNDYVLIDLNSVTFSSYNLITIANHILDNKNEKFLVIAPTYSKSIVSDGFFNGLDITPISTTSIFHYYNLIYSCKKIICLWSGGSVLAATIKNQYKPSLEIDCFKNYNQHPHFGLSDKSHYWYDNINYISS